MKRKVTWNYISSIITFAKFLSFKLKGDLKNNYTNLFQHMMSCGTFCPDMISQMKGWMQ